jgi:hypothetical protein
MSCCGGERDECRATKYTIYESPLTHKFTLLRLPNQFIEGDPLPVSPTDHWFDSREEAVAALPELLNRED